MLNKIRNRLLLSIIIGIGIFVALSIYANINNMITAFCSFKWTYIPLIIFLIFLNYIFRFFKWDYYLKKIGLSINRKGSVIIFFSGLAMSVTPAKFGELLKSYLLKKLNGTEISRSAPIVFAERVTDLIGLIILASIGFSTFAYGREVLLFVIVSILLAILVIQSKKICLQIIDLIAGVHFISKFSENIHTLYESAYTLFTLKNLLIAVLLSMISWFFECLALFFVLKGFNMDVSLLASMFVFSFSTIAGVLSMIPGGLGMTEGSMTWLLIIDGTPKEIAVGATLVIRSCTLWFGVLVGLMTLYSYRTKFEG
ncbi:MAG: lysylphosphatidylglycerol synthase transmembrane domain-containing protein [Candidatus Altiarchaeota archaeon]|nr:lysylphosphatidylglycerol synthase transmembrane domain-containing protein [Candidatus Altiarchaeota archaeon]